MCFENVQGFGIERNVVSQRAASCGVHLWCRSHPGCFMLSVYLILDTPRLSCVILDVLLVLLVTHRAVMSTLMLLVTPWAASGLVH